MPRFFGNHSHDTSAAITGLSPNTTYQVQVAARNSVGLGPRPATDSGTTSAGVPDAPRLSHEGFDRLGDPNLSWTLPNNGGSTITGYKIQQRPLAQRGDRDDSRLTPAA